MRRSLIIVIAIVLAALGLPVISGAASAVDQPGGRLVSDDPANFTPHVLDGRSYSIAQVGSTMVLGGTFAQVQEQGATVQLARANLFAFDAASGKVSATFVPNPNGVVNSVIPTGDGQSVYVGGSFTNLGGVAVKNLARVRVSDGAIMPTFNGGSPSGPVTDLRLAAGRLWVAGGFTHIAGKAQPALATLNASTGAFDAFMSLKVAGLHNSGFTTVRRIDVDAAGRRLVAIGNFDTLDGVKYHQMFALDTTGSRAAPAFQTAFYDDICSRSFDSYMRELDIDPSGAFVVVSTTGAHGGPGRACDSVARFELSSSGSDVRPTWVNNTGGDTTYAVEVVEGVVYSGGHFRWQNNPFAADTPGPGAVSRPGIAALDPQNGLPLDWNPTRTKGVGVFDLLATPQGLWVLSDTDRIGKAYEYHARVALMPAAGGKAVPAIKDPSLPNDVYAAGPLGAASDPRVLYRVNAGGGEVPAARGIDWAPDTLESPSPYHNADMNRAGWSPVSSVDGTVPAGTPSSIFDSELWDGGGGEEMHWGFPVQAGVPVQVRLYFANRCGCTAGVGQRVFDVAIDGSTKLDDLDLVAAVGHDRGTMRAFDVTSDGTVDIDFTHVVENPLVNGIEIVRTDVAPGGSASILKRSLTSSGTGAPSPVTDASLDGHQVRGAFMVNGVLYTALADGTFVRRSFDGSTYGSPTAANTQDALTPLGDWADDIRSATGLFYHSGRIYFTRAGSSTLYSRGFTAQSDVVAAQRLEASPSVEGIDFSKVKGMFATAESLYWATADGDLHRIGFAAGAPVPRTAQVVSGPSSDGASWASRALFLFQDGDGAPADQSPTASFETTCTGLSCSLDANGSAAPGSAIASYTWDFGDGTTGSGGRVSHRFERSDTFTVTLTVRTAKNKTATTTREVQVVRVNEGPKASFTASCDQLTCAFDATGSADDVSVESYAWDFGDGTSGTGARPTHDFASPGERTVTLVVTDDDGATDVATRQVTTTTAAAATVEHVASATTNGNRSRHAVTVPAGVRAGDALLLYLTTNASSPVTAPSGWEQLKAVDVDGLTSRVWARTATAPDAGSVVAVTTAATIKSDVSVVAYRSSTGQVSVDDAAATAVTGATSSLGTPAVTARADRSELVSYWAVKSSTDVLWGVPAGQQKRIESTGTSAGRVSALLTDARVVSGRQGSLTVATGTAVSRGAAYSVLLAPVATGGTTPPGGGTPPAPSTSLSHVGAASTNGNRVTHQVRVPSTVVAGDRLLLAMTVGTSTAVTAPAGWAEVRSADANGLRATVWTKVAGGDDAASIVAVATSAYTKSDLTVTAYRSTVGTPSVAASGATVASSTSSPKTPTLDAEGATSWLVSYWGVKGSADLAWTVPSDQQERSQSTGTLSGRVSALLADSGSPVPAGTRGGLSAGTSSIASRAASFSVLVSAG